MSNQPTTDQQAWTAWRQSTDLRLDALESYVRANAKEPVDNSETPETNEAHPKSHGQEVAEATLVRADTIGGYVDLLWREAGCVPYFIMREPSYTAVLRQKYMVAALRRLLNSEIAKAKQEQREDNEKLDAARTACFCQPGEDIANKIGSIFKTQQSLAKKLEETERRAIDAVRQLDEAWRAVGGKDQAGTLAQVIASKLEFSRSSLVANFIDGEYFYGPPRPYENREMSRAVSIQELIDEANNCTGAMRKLNKGAKEISAAWQAVGADTAGKLADAIRERIALDAEHLRQAIQNIKDARTAAHAKEGQSLPDAIAALSDRVAQTTWRQANAATVEVIARAKAEERERCAKIADYQSAPIVATIIRNGRRDGLKDKPESDPPRHDMPKWEDKSGHARHSIDL